jgi:hypothetical protein
LAVELREDEVSDLDPAIAVAAGPATRLAAAEILSEVEVELAARAAGARVARRAPEIVFAAEARDLVRPDPISSRQIAKASSSSSNTDGRKRSVASGRTFVKNSQFQTIASRLK